MIGLTPMIGRNDTPDEVFTLADAKRLAAFAAHQHLGLVSFWSLGRDRQCASQSLSAQDNCSGVSQAPWQFSRLLRR